MANRWEKPDIPHKGWRCTNVIDLRPDGERINADEYGTCEMGNHPPLRFVHVMEHDEYNGSLNVGCVCAEKMSNDYVTPKAREKQLRNKAARKRRWPSLKKWRTSEDGSSYLLKNGMWMSVCQINTGRWMYHISYMRGTRPKPSPDSYPTEDVAKLALFEKYWKEIIRQGISVSGPTEQQDDEPRDAFGRSYLDYKLPDDMGGGTLRERKQLDDGSYIL